VVIEVLDARLPGSSANPLLAELTGHKPNLKVLNKQDVADPERTAAVAGLVQRPEPGTRAVGWMPADPAPARKLIDACHLLAPNRGGMAKPMRVLICGVPNVGKSTLINTLTNKRQAKTGDEAGITKLEQRITLADDFYLWDTPGMLWPRITVVQSGYNLAASGAVGRNAYDEEEVALELLRRLQAHYAPLLEARYKLGLPAGVAAMHDEDLLAAIGRQRGAMLGGGRVNLQKAAEIVMTEFRTATLGRITLETPAGVGPRNLFGRQAHQFHRQAGGLDAALRARVQVQGRVQAGDAAHARRVVPGHVQPGADAYLQYAAVGERHHLAALALHGAQAAGDVQRPGQDMAVVPGGGHAGEGLGELPKNRAGRRKVFEIKGLAGGYRPCPGLSTALSSVGRDNFTAPRLGFKPRRRRSGSGCRCRSRPGG
jgi:ribosome biogenesis GTPase A